MKNINGYENEIEFIKYLNNKNFSETTPLFQNMLQTIFKNNLDNQKIICYKTSGNKKSDITIKINNEIKYVSIKKGINNSVHVEPLSEFILFLIRNGLSDEDIRFYYKYHYGDGTTDGTGEERKSVEDIKNKYQDRIDLLNEKFNNLELIEKAIDRFIVYGRNSKTPIDAIIYGYVNDFLFLKKEDIYNIILSKKEMYSTGLHFGPLFIQPQNRCLNYNLKYEKQRHNVQVKWFNLADDIIECMNNHF